MTKVIFVEVSVGKLPEWYLADEENNDHYLQDAIEREWHKNPKFADAQIRVSYNYQTEYAIVVGYDDDGNRVFVCDNHDYTYALEYAKRFN